MGGGEVREHTTSVLMEVISVSEGVNRCEDNKGMEGTEGRTSPLPLVRRCDLLED